MNKGLLIIAIENCIMAVCWTFLAYFFNKWWIALFMLLCFSDYKYSKNDNK